MRRMLDGSEQRELAVRMRELFSEQGLPVVFVGSTAVVGLELYERSTKDADALAAYDLTIDEVRVMLKRIATDEGLDIREKGWGTVALVNLDEVGDILWEVDVITPDEGMIPSGAARRIQEHAVETAIGPTAIAEHILAMKAIAYGDCTGKGQVGAAAKYAGDLHELRRALGNDISWQEVIDLLSEFHGARRQAAAAKIGDVFGRDLDLPSDPDPAVG